MIEQTNTPKLRFPEFKNEWSYDLLSDVVTNKSKKFDPKKEEATKDIELDSIEQNTGRLLDTYISNDFTSQKNKFKKGNVLYSKLRLYLNKYYYAIIDGVCSSEIWVLNTLNKDVLVNKFLYYFIQTNRFSSVTNKSAGSKMPRADWELVKNIRLYKGSIKEQEKIGYFFSKLDRHIELEEEKLELLEQQKRGYMQKIFSQQLRFKDEKGNDYPKWIFKKFEEIFKVVPSKKYQIKSSEIEDNASIPVIDQGQNLILGFSNNKEKVFNDFKNVIIYGDHTTVIKRSDKPFIIGGDGVKLLTSKVDSDISYLYNALQYFNVKSEGYKRHFSILKNKDFYISTSIEEQKKIANIFNKLDKYIEKQFAKVELLKQRKQGLLQKMFV
ncbi:restriction endonuclease subunit S [Staphylococcus sp. HMSC076H12]|uniref:restriction endonuclease subunit S n=1 Tax=Staphylococcus sp. HMSC076H12 TaxID=1739449 RepID=UPI0008A412DC|nr:restriction endonuclease subunit S [Staphylococcus sp. HMSC076H12]OFQ27014.1 type I restriction endonuclease subunit S [Staphylococcus sp. HMSC076H12]